MGFNLQKVVPWGRSLHEYTAMFALSQQDLKKRILGCADGPASFNAELTKRGGHVVSVDPIYHFSADEINTRIDETYLEVLKQVRQNKDEFVWSHIPSVDGLANMRMTAMQAFLVDYASGQKEGRYIEASLPTLPFDDGEYELVLCSHFLFLYSAHFSRDFHIQSIKELCRVGKEARIFPLLQLGATPSPHLEGVLAGLSQDGFVVRVEDVPYEFQKGGNQMLRVTKGVASF